MSAQVEGLDAGGDWGAERYSAVGLEHIVTAAKTQQARAPGPAVLHVTEAFGGGIVSSLVHMARALPGGNQHLLYRARVGVDTGDSVVDGFATVHVFDSLLELPRKIEALVTEIGVDLVHLHSSWAGLFGRLRRSGRVPIVYSPHGFMFESRDQAWPLRRLAWLVERQLARRADLLVCLSPYEQERARRLGARTAYVPNTVTNKRASGGYVGALGVSSRDGRTTLVTAGRVCPAKDPEFFVRVVEALRRLRDDVRWVWIGSGDADSERALHRAGVEVTGWLPRQEVEERLHSADLYVHTAAWECNPMTPLEASAGGIPVIARSIASLVSLGYPDGLARPDEMAAAIDRHISGEAVVEPLHVPTEEDQRRALLAAYTSARRIHGSRPSSVRT